MNRFCLTGSVSISSSVMEERKDFTCCFFSFSIWYPPKKGELLAPPLFVAQNQDVSYGTRSVATNASVVVESVSYNLSGGLPSREYSAVRSVIFHAPRFSVSCGERSTREHFSPDSPP